MKFFIVSILFFFISLVTGCRPKYEPDPCYTTFNDLEESLGWFPSNANNGITIESGDAYSGNRFVRIRNGHDFGYFFKTQLKELSCRKVSWIKYSTICKKISGGIRDASVVCSVTDSLDRQIEWIEVPLSFKLIERNKWTPIHVRFDISKKFDLKNNVALFIWTKGIGDHILQDDIKIEFFE
jgi:hypothetical protein